MAKKVMFSRPIKKQTLAEQMADTIKELILSGELSGGDTLPTEPELCEQFGVSRTVVRDATRILMAIGLVEVVQGAGVFVTASQSGAFGEALLIALRRSGASAWDVEHFDQIILPEVIALASFAATNEEIAEIRDHIESYRQVLFEYYTKSVKGKPHLPADTQSFLDGLQKIMTSIFNASHNRVFQQLAQPLLNLRSLRYWQSDEKDTPESLVEIEIMYLSGLVDAIASRDPISARNRIKQLMALPPEAIEAMKQTPVGEQPQIPLSISRYMDDLLNNQE
jgi:DNA-binding FadR family transcriptional regulator